MTWPPRTRWGRWRLTRDHKALEYRLRKPAGEVYYVLLSDCRTRDGALLRDVVATCAACRALIRLVHLPRAAKRAYCWRCCPACGGALPLPEETDRDAL